MNPDEKKRAFKDLAVIASMVNLCLLRVWREVIYIGPTDVYWANVVTVEALVAALLNLALISMALWAGAVLVRRGGKVLDICGRLGLIGMLVVPLNFLREALDIGSETLYWLLSNPLIGGSIAIVVLLPATYLLVFRLASFSRAVALLALILLPFVLVTSGQACWMLATTAADPPRLDRIELDETSLPMPRGKPRVLWIMFDEFDLRLGFLERPELIMLPHLDRMREQSLFAVATDAHRKNTRFAIPSYTIGRLVDSTAPRGPNDLSLGFEDDSSGTLHSWTEQPTFFSRAQASGAKVGAIGIYHPYCRLFANALSYCEQYTIGTYAPQPKDGVLAEMAVQLRALTPLASRLNGIDMYRGILENTMDVVGDARLDVVYVHASVPHGPAIFDRHSKSFTPFNRDPLAYFDNLVLADRFFGQIRAQMEHTGTWDSTTVLVTSDHEWRRSEDYDGIRVSKTPFILKMADQSEEILYDRPFSPMLVTDDLLLEILRGEVSSPTAIADWLDAHTPEL